MKIQVTENAMIFRKDFDNGVAYSTTISKKQQDGTYDNAYIGVKFRKGVELQNQTKIDIKDGWITFWKKDNKPVLEIFVNDFELMDNLPDGIELVADDLPF